jgi:hypothetical protein
VATLLALSLLGCGGKSSSPGDDGGGNGGGASGGGTSVGGSGTKLRDCQVDGITYKSGDSFKAPDGCNTCSCDDGEIGCTLKACVGDGCTEVDAEYQGLLERAKFCDPQGVNECTQLVASGLTCGCQTFVNPNAFANNLAAELQEEFAVVGCGQGVLCDPCPSPSRGYCAANGQCADLQDFGEERACKVGGVTYPSGATGIQDPFSCNQCSCQDGVLGCDDAACPKPCPDNTQPGKGCAECGPVDNCLIVEYDCMPACVETCAQGVCVDGACVNYCG